MRTGILDTGIIPVSVSPAGIPVSRLPTGIGQWDKVVMSIARSMVRSRHVRPFSFYFLLTFCTGPALKEVFFSHFNVVYLLACLCQLLCQMQQLFAASPSYFCTKTVFSR